MMKNYLFAGFVAATMLLATACEKENAPVKPSETPEPKTPQLALTKGEVSEYSFDFTIESSDAETVKWICIEKDSRTVDAAFVLTNGTDTEVDKKVSITVENLNDDTAYTVYAAASNKDKSVLSSPLEVTTLKYIPPVNTIEITGTQASCNPAPSGDLMNFYITFTDDEGNAFKADLYTEADKTWLPSGTYNLGEIAAGVTSINYTSFADASDPYTLIKFVSGSIAFEAEPNEETLEIVYTVSGEFAMESGDILKISYNGQIAGISLPAPEIEQSTTIVFNVSPSTSQPEFYYRNDAQPGWYPVKFTDKDWGTLKVTIMVDPALCDDGKAPLPAGEYSIAAGTVRSDSKIDMYNPERYGSFDSCTVSVSVNGDEYTFDLEATGDFRDGKTMVVMQYTGTIADYR